MKQLNRDSSETFLLHCDKVMRLVDLLENILLDSLSRSYIRWTDRIEIPSSDTISPCNTNSNYQYHTALGWVDLTSFIRQNQ